ncbi:hypothetical protein A0O34_00555 [Chryseobacterium glaciei]|uniref:Uncharacterized protein n=1 Tax=Chryseobacterium glaciei TaxID=1685010 RepID=A0A172XQ38_9FLAO|nr:hypothetical protein A0O34_00555 [Chryseobacterium glaciei]
MVSAINNGGQVYRMEVYIHEAKMSGVTIHNSCINLSELQKTVYGKDVCLGFMSNIGQYLYIQLVVNRKIIP